MVQLDYVAYLTFRLLPFLVASVLSLAPMFNHNARGIVYLVGLLLASTATSLSGHYMLSPELTQVAGAASVSCATFSLDATRVYSRTPLDLSVLGYSTGYLFYCIFANDLVGINLATLVFFPLATCLTLWWLVVNYCFSYVACALSLVASSGLGVLWAYLVQKRAPGLQYLYTPSNKEACVKQSDGVYKCSDTNNNGSIK